MKTPYFAYLPFPNFAENVWSENENGTGAMAIAKNEVFVVL